MKIYLILISLVIPSYSFSSSDHDVVKKEEKPIDSKKLNKKYKEYEKAFKKTKLEFLKCLDSKEPCVQNFSTSRVRLDEIGPEECSLLESGHMNGKDIDKCINKKLRGILKACLNTKFEHPHTEAYPESIVFYPFFEGDTRTCEFTKTNKGWKLDFISAGDNRIVMNTYYFLNYF